MTTTDVRPTRQEARAGARPTPSRIWTILTTTDHKLIGVMYLVVCFVFFFIGGLMALLIRAELFLPGMQFLANEQFNQLFTMHGTVCCCSTAPRSWSASRTT